MSLSDIVVVNITTTAKGVSQAGFGTPMLFAYHTRTANVVDTYEDLASMVSDGFTVNDPAYKMAASVLAQTPNVTSFKVGRRTLPYTQVMRITPVTGGTGFVHTVTVVSPDGTSTTVSYTELLADAVADIVTAIQALLNAISDLTATDDTTHCTCTADNAGELFYYNSPSSTMHLQDMTTDPGIATDQAAIELEDPDWYGGILDSQSEAEIKASQAYIETLNKVAAYSTADWGAIDSGTSDDVMSDMQTSAYDRCVIGFSADHDGYQAAAWIGTMFPTAPGSATWSYKSLSGVAADSLNVTQQNTVEGKNGNYYITIKGLNMTFDGKTPGGTFIDIIRGRDWLQARLEERIVQLMYNNAKIPFTDKGVDLIRSQVIAQLREGQDAGYLARDPDFVVTAPLVANVSATNKANRILPDVNFSATLQGAIHKVLITGTISV
jgi:hypothetical protein